MKRKITGMALSVMLFALCLPAEAQAPKKIPRIGFMIPGSQSTYAIRIEAFRTGLRELG